MPLHKVPVGLWGRLRLREGICSRLPPHYLRSLQEARAPAPVHYRPRGAGAGSGAGGRRERVQDVPIPVYRPPEAQLGLWGGEGWVVGYRYVGDDKLSKRVKKVWKPQLLQRELYSEILDTKFAVTVTARTLDLIDAAYGFDFYILKANSEEDLCSKFGMDLKRGMLLRLSRQDPQLHPDNPQKRAAIYDKYKEFVIPEAEAEWVGLTLDEAMEKQRLLEEKDPIPLFKVYVEELIGQLEQQALSEPVVVQKRASRE